MISALGTGHAKEQTHASMLFVPPVLSATCPEPARSEYVQLSTNLTGLLATITTQTQPWMLVILAHVMASIFASMSHAHHWINAIWPVFVSLLEAYARTLCNLTAPAVMMEILSQLTTLVILTAIALELILVRTSRALLLARAIRLEYVQMVPARIHRSQQVSSATTEI